MDPHPPVSSARSNPADVISGRFASLPSTAQARGGLLGSSHPRPGADPGRGFWRRVSLGRWHPGVTLDPLVQSAWGSQLCEELSLRGCPVSHPHTAHNTALIPGSPGTHPDAQQFGLISSLLRFGKPLVGTALGMAPPHTKYQQKRCPLDKKRIFLTPTFEFSAFSDFCVIRIKKKKRLFTLNRRQIVCIVVVYFLRKKWKLPRISPPTCSPGV